MKLFFSSILILFSTISLSQNFYKDIKIKISERSSFKILKVKYSTNSIKSLQYKNSPINRLNGIFKSEKDSSSGIDILRKRYIIEDCNDNFDPLFSDIKIYYCYIKPIIRPQEKRKFKFYFYKNLKCEYFDYLYDIDKRIGTKLIIDLNQKGKNIEYRLENFTK